ncbi:hypothetical protein ACQEVG_38115 [Streptomyces sp. CA-135486]|uniref:hypothetical protein n=1 Tax=Streptomyces sp. CA-135486 TaxID=3240049 RepID=UPI003D8F37C8
MRLGGSLAPWHELENAHWLRLQPATGPGRGSVAAQLLDDLRTAPTRRDRARAADWALRVSCTKRLRLRGAYGRLGALAVAAHTPAGTAHGTAENSQLSRACGLPVHELANLLDLLGEVGFVTSWKFEPDSEDLTWILHPPAAAP